MPACKLQAAFQHISAGVLPSDASHWIFLLEQPLNKSLGAIQKSSVDETIPRLCRKVLGLDNPLRMV